jgi:hypothetical protein
MNAGGQEEEKGVIEEGKTGNATPSMVMVFDVDDVANGNDGLEVIFGFRSGLRCLGIVLLFENGESRNG